MNQTFDAFIFDLDGTLLDTLPDLVIVTNRALEEEGFPPRTEMEILSYIGSGIKSLLTQALPENTDEGSINKVLQRWKDLYSAHGNDHTEEFTGMSILLEDLKQRGKKLGVLSNKFEAGVKLLMEEYFPGVFDITHGESDEIPRKPDPAGLLRTINELGVTPEQAVYIGDSPNDILTAHKIGVYAMGVSWGYHKVMDLKKADADLMALVPGDILRVA